MKVSTVVISLSMALTTALASQAQNIAASSGDVARCADWVNKTVPAHLNGRDFCAGIIGEEGPYGWASAIHNCGQQTANEKDRAQMFCTSSGQVGPDWAIAAGYTGIEPDGGSEFITGTHGGRTSYVTLYSRTPWHVGDTRLPAGFSQVTLSRTNGKWQMAIQPEKEKVIRTVQLLSDSSLSAKRNELAIGVNYGVRRCSDALHMELVFTYAGTDLYACIRPDHIPPMAAGSATTR